MQNTGEGEGEGDGGGEGEGERDGEGVGEGEGDGEGEGGGESVRTPAHMSKIIMQALVHLTIDYNESYHVHTT